MEDLLLKCTELTESMEVFNEFIDEINAMGDKVKTIASTIEKVADQSAALQEKSENIATE